MAQQLRKAVETATAPHQYAMSRRLGQCVAHVLEVLTEIDPQAMIVSIDGVGAYDSREKPCWKLSSPCLESPKRCRLYVRSTANLRGMRWKMSSARFTTSTKEGEGGGQGGRSSCSLWANMQFWRYDCSPERSSSLSWTMFTLSPLLVGSISFTTSCKKSCTGILESASTWGRITFGMPLVTGHLLAIFWRGSRKLQTQRRGCGRDLACPRRNRRFASWALHWDISIPSKLSSEE